MEGLRIIDGQADLRFRSLARCLRLDPDHPWIGGYAEYEWRQSRHLFDRLRPSMEGKSVLEFGCNVGATAIVLAALGARVTAVDISKRMLVLARANARRYGAKITFAHCPSGDRLPLGDETFDFVVCNSVLEYVAPDLLKPVQRELDRVLRPQGILVITGTSNRLWPREVHSGQWLVNYLPPAFDRLLFRADGVQRGVFPWQLTEFAGYTNMDLEDGCQAYLESRARMGSSKTSMGLLRAASAFSGAVGVSVGLLTPNICVTLKKPG